MDEYRRAIAEVYDDFQLVGHLTTRVVLVSRETPTDPTPAELPRPPTAYGPRHGDAYAVYSPHSGVPIDARMIGTVAAARLEAASLIPHGGGAVAILIGAIFVAVAVGIVAIELRRNQYLWMLASFVAALVLISLIHAAVAP